MSSELVNRHLGKVVKCSKVLQNLCIILPICQELDVHHGEDYALDLGQTNEEYIQGMTEPVNRQFMWSCNQLCSMASSMSEEDYQRCKYILTLRGIMDPSVM